MRRSIGTRNTALSLLRKPSPSDSFPTATSAATGRTTSWEKTGSAVCDSLHETAAEAEAAMEPQSRWYSDGAVLRTKFADNGDEARSVTELTLTAGGECLTGVNEGACDVLSIDKQPDGHVICYTYGDFCSHEATRSSRITVENGEMLITDTAQYGGL